MLEAKMVPDKKKKKKKNQLEMNSSVKKRAPHFGMDPFGAGQKETHFVNLDLHIETEISDNEIDEFQMVREDQVQDEILRYETDSDIESMEDMEEMLY
jgi:hypothetical protein